MTGAEKHRQTDRDDGVPLREMDQHRVVNGKKPTQATSIIEHRGANIAHNPGQIRRVDAWHYRVRSQSGPAWYDVTWRKRFWRCDCTFNRRTHRACKHIYAVLSRISAPEQADDGPESCPSCEGHGKTVRRGYYKSRSGIVQRYQCKRCGIKFSTRTGFKGMKYTANVITTALDLYFKGLSLRSIADHLNQIHGFHASHLTVYRWVRKYMQLIVCYVKRLKPVVSKSWHADDMRVSVNGASRNLWNLMDHRTRYLITIQMTKHRGAREAKQLLMNALKSTERKRLALISDGLSSYQRAVRDLQKNDKRLRIKHLPDCGLAKQKSNNRLERLNGTLRERVRLMRGLANDRSSRKLAEAYAAYYNHIRRHSALRGKTPGQAAKTWLPTESNRWHSLIKASLSRTGHRDNEYTRKHEYREPSGKNQEIKSSRPHDVAHTRFTATPIRRGAV